MQGTFKNSKEWACDCLKKHLKASPYANHLKKMHSYWNTEK